MNKKLEHKDREIVMKKYDITYSSYDELYGKEQFKKYRNSLSKIQFDLAKDKEMNFLDIGCGTGLILEFIERENIIKNKGCFYYIGLDLSLNSVRLAYLKRNGFITDFIVGDGEKIPIRLDAIDTAVSYTVIHHFRDPVKFICMLLKNVRGNLIITGLKNDESIQSITENIDFLRREVKRDFLYNNILDEKDEIIIFRIDTES